MRSATMLAVEVSMGNHTIDFLLDVSCLLHACMPVTPCLLLTASLPAHCWSCRQAVCALLYCSPVRHLQLQPVLAFMVQYSEDADISALPSER